MFQKFISYQVIIISVFCLYTMPLLIAQVTDNSKLPSNKAKIEEKQSMLNGFYGQKWGDKFQDVLKAFEVLSKTNDSEIKIEQVQQNKLIKIRRNNIQYTYSFYQKPKKIEEYQTLFPKTPYGILNTIELNISEDDKTQQKKSLNITPMPKEKNVEKKNTITIPQAQLSHVQSNFSSTNSEFIKKILISKYGKPNRYIEGESKQGAFIWTFSEGFIIQTTEEYNQQQYTNKIIYLSKQISEKMLRELKLYQHLKEEYILKDLLL